MIVFNASAVVSAALREDGVPERALLRAEETDVFKLSAEVDAEIAGVLERPRFAAAISAARRARIRACATKRKVSGGTMSEDGRTARDVLLGLMKTCRNLGVPFYRYLDDRPRVPGAMPIPLLPDLVRQAATPT